MGVLILDSLYSGRTHPNKPYFHNPRQYKADLGQPHMTNRFTTRSVHSDIHFPEDEKEKKTRTGSYELNPAPMYGSLNQESRSSGEYDYPDPFPTGTRRTFYDNPGLQAGSTPAKVSIYTVI